MRIQTSAENTIKDVLLHQIVLKTKITFLLRETLLFFLEQKYILFSEAYFF